MDELLKVGVAQLITQLGLAEQEQLEHEILVGIDVRQEANFLEFVEAEVLGLVDNEERLLAASVLVDQKVDERLVLLDLVSRGHLEIEGDAHPVHDLTDGLMRVRDESDAQVVVQLLQQIAHQRRLARADLSRQDREARLVVQAILDERQGFPVDFAEVEEAGIGQQREGLFIQTKEGFVHLQVPS
nr:hypothetical protein [Thiocystis violacea]